MNICLDKDTNSYYTNSGVENFHFAIFILYLIIKKEDDYEKNQKIISCCCLGFDRWCNSKSADVGCSDRCKAD